MALHVSESAQPYKDVTGPRGPTTLKGHAGQPSGSPPGKPSLPFQFLRHFRGVLVLGIQRQRFFVALDRQIRLARGLVGVTEAVMRIPRIRRFPNVEFEGLHRLVDLLRLEQAIAEVGESAEAVAVFPRAVAWDLSLLHATIEAERRVHPSCALDKQHRTECIRRGAPDSESTWFALPCLESAISMPNFARSVGVVQSPAAA